MFDKDKEIVFEKERERKCLIRRKREKVKGKSKVFDKEKEIVFEKEREIKCLIKRKR